MYRLHTLNGICALEKVMTGELRHDLEVDDGMLHFDVSDGYAYFLMNGKSNWVRDFFTWSVWEVTQDNKSRMFASREHGTHGKDGVELVWLDGLQAKKQVGYVKIVACII
jgi:hypothetical protein